ncbi:sugar ABC transporter ATP-binding protein [Blastococcus sp. SYSU D00669]
MPGTMLLLEARDVVKRYQGVTALDGASLQVAPAEIHALLGGNGAGKSTLINILSGLTPADSGTILLDGEEVSFDRPSDAHAAGITTIHQELSLVPALTTLDNIFLGRETTSRAFGIGLKLDRRRMAERVASLAAEFGLTREDLALPVGEFGALKKRVVEIVKALVFDPRLLILDEPTSGLEEEEKHHLFGHMRRLRSRGVSLIWVTHHLEELFGLADAATVFRDGRTVGSLSMADATLDRLMSMMFGGAADEFGRAPVHHDLEDVDHAGEEVLRLEGVSRANVLRDIALQVRAGEIVGISGLAGAGRTELARVIMGLDRPSSGSIWLKGSPLKIRNASKAYRRGLAMVPEDRKQLGILADLSVAQNVAISNLASVSRLGFVVSRKAEAERGDTFRERLSIRTPDVRQPIGNLSGGNQQKAVVARCLNTEPALIIFDEPTQGIDVAAKVAVHNLIREFVASGGAAIVIASEVGELVELSHRVLVMRQGRIVGRVDRVPEALANGQLEQVKQRILSLSARSDHP